MVGYYSTYNKTTAQKSASAIYRSTIKHFERQHNNMDKYINQKTNDLLVPTFIIDVMS